MIFTLLKTARRIRALYQQGYLAWSVWRSEGLSALLRRLQKRRQASTAPSTLTLPPPPPAGAHLDVLYVIGYWPGEPKRYRVFNPLDVLNRAGYRVHALTIDHISDIVTQKWTAKTLVMFRASDDLLSGAPLVLRYARQVGMTIVFDIDDLLFDPTLLPRIDGYKAMPSWEARQFARSMQRFRRMAKRCDQMSAPTPALCRGGETLGLPSHLIQNSLNQRQLDLANLILADKTPHDDLRIGYFSGSRTHQKDFQQCQSALLAIMKAHTNVTFWLAGYLDLDEQWAPFSDRIRRIPFMSPEEMLRCLGAIDINLAPLETGNPFCEAKSELKFFESALVTVPTVASPTEPFVRAIHHGETGFLAQDEESWILALERLVSDSSLRVRMGHAARHAVLTDFSPQALLHQIEQAYGLSHTSEPCSV